MWAAENGHGGAMKILFGQKGPAMTGRTNGAKHHSDLPPGMDVREWTKCRPGEEMATTNKPDRLGQTPLPFAAPNEHGRVVALMRCWKAAASNTI